MTQDSWFFHPDLPPEGVITIDPQESRHATGSRRLGVGDEITLFDGCGRVAQCAIETVDAKQRNLSVRVISSQSHTPAQLPVHLVCALPKGDRCSTMLGMCTQLGMTRFTPLRTDRSVVEPKPAATDRWRRIMIEACKQSRNPWLPEICEAVELHELSLPSGALVAHPGGVPIATALREMDNHSPLVLVIGPEGGFTDAEIERLRNAGAKPVDLGPGVLRIETAAVAAVVMARLYE